MIHFAHPTALDDQLQAAARDALAMIRRAGDTGATVDRARPTPWLASRISDIARRAQKGTARGCVHLAAGPPHRGRRLVAPEPGDLPGVHRGAADPGAGQRERVRPLRPAR